MLHLILWRLRDALVLSLSLTGMAAASADHSRTCEIVASEAAQSTGVPVTVLNAIALTETGRKSAGGLRAWPWTVNMEGKGHWFETADEARAFVFKEFKRGARSFDVGCFQINYKWHGEAFSSIDEMFDPRANALYAARFLAELYQETGSWSKAAGAYHSRTPEYAQRYTQRFDRFRAALSGNGAPEAGNDIPEIPDIVLAANGSADLPPAPRENRYPLLRRSGGPAGPLGGAAGASLFATTLTKAEVE